HRAPCPLFFSIPFSPLLPLPPNFTLFPYTTLFRSYYSYTGDMVHRFYHMWQQSDCDVRNATRADPAGCLRDLYPYVGIARGDDSDRKSTRLNSSHGSISYAVFCLKKKNNNIQIRSH